MRRRVVGKVAETIDGQLQLPAWVQEAEVPELAWLMGVMPLQSTVAAASRARGCAVVGVMPSQSSAMEGAIAGVMPIAAWRLDETAGTNAADAIGSLDGTHYTAEGNLYVDQAGIIGKAVKYGDAGWTSGTAYTDMGNVLDFDRTDGFAISLWVNVDTFVDEFAVLAKVDGSFTGYDIRITSGPKLAFNLRGSGQALSLGTVDSISDGWVHVVVSKGSGSAASDVAIYIDGSAASTTTFSDTLTSSSTSNTGPLRVGGVFENSVTYIDDVGIFRRALSATDARRIHDAGRYGGVSVAQWWTWEDTLSDVLASVSPILWLDAAVEVFEDASGTDAADNNDGVARWDTQDGGPNHYRMPTAANRPTWIENAWSDNQPAVRFDRGAGTYQLLLPEVGATITSETSTDYTVFAVLNQRSETDNPQLIFRFGGADALVLVGTGIPRNELTYFEGTYQSSGALAVAGEQLVVWELDSGAGEFRIRRNGTQVGSGIYTAAAWDTGYLGSYATSTAFVCDIDLAHFIIVPDLLPSHDLEAIESRLKARFGV